MKERKARRSNHEEKDSSDGKGNHDTKRREIRIPDRRKKGEKRNQISRSKRKGREEKLEFQIEEKRERREIRFPDRREKGEKRN